MPASAHVVAVIAEPDAALRLRDVSARVPAWVADTPANRTAAAELRAAGGAGARADITLFRVDPDTLPDDWVVGVLGAVVEHHGEHGHAPPLAALELYGVLVTDALRAVLSTYGLDHVTSNGDVVLAQVAPAA